MKRDLEALLLDAPVLFLGMAIGAYLNLLFAAIGLPLVSLVLLTLACIIGTAAYQLIRRKQIKRLKERWTQFGTKHNNLVRSHPLISSLYAMLGMLAIYETPGEFAKFEKRLSELCQVIRAGSMMVVRGEGQDA